jgi:hypothetical protein
MSFVPAILIAAVALASAPIARAADAEADSWDVIATMAAALAEPNEYAFMKPIAKSLEEHDLIERQVRVLVNTNNVTSSISPLANEGDDKTRTLEVDWYMEIQSHSPGQSLIQRRENVKLVMMKTGKRWMITALSPVAFFTAPSTN